MEESDSDTDAIIQNSPLDQYLQETMEEEGTSLFAEVPSTSDPQPLLNDPEESEEVGSERDESPQSGHYSNSVDRLCFTLLRLTHTPTSIARKVSVPKILSSVTSGDLIKSDDAELLSNAAELHSVGTEASLQYPYHLRLIILVSVSSALALSLFRADTGTEGTLQSLVIWMLLLLLHLRHYILYRESLREWRLLHNAVTNAIEETTLLWKGVKKTLLEIREREILGRGYTIASREVPIEFGSSELRKSRMYCEGLRRDCFLGLKKLNRILRVQAADLDQWKDLYSEEEKGSSLSFADFSTLNPLFQSEEIESDDWLSFEALKALTEFTRMFISDLVRCYLIGQSRSITGPDRGSKWAQVAQIAQSASSRIKTASSMYCEISAPSKRKVSTRDEGCGPGLSTHSALRSLELHLEEALLKTRETDENNVCESSLKQIQHSLAAAQTCWEEIEELINPSKPLPPILPPPSIPSSPKRVISEDFQPTIKDEVFEASSKEISSAQLKGVDEEESTQSNQEREVDRKEASRLLKELKSVLGLRSDSMRMRELKALAEFRDVTLEQILDEEEKENKKEPEEDDLVPSKRSEIKMIQFRSEDEKTSNISAPVGMSDFAALIASRSAAMRREAVEETFLGDGEISGTESEEN